jgi:long-chain-fatty-acid--CoA ligase ACSBG
MFESAKALFPSAPALKCERPVGSGNWKSWTYAEYYEQSMGIARSLLSVKMGFVAHDTVNIIGFNSPEWFQAQMGAIMAGGAAAGVYTTNEPSACEYVAVHSEAKVIFVEDAKQMAKYAGFKEQCANLKALVQWTGTCSPGSGRVLGITWDAFNELGKNVSVERVKDRSEGVKPGHCATLIYTSGTTGNPKAVMISHDNMIYETLSAMVTMFEGTVDKRPPPDELRIVSYLPLSHVAAQMLDIAGPLVITGLGNGYGPSLFHHCYYTTWFADPGALKGTLKTTLVACRPTFFLGVPRVWEKIKETLLEIGRQNKGLKKTLSTWAKKHAAMAAKERQLGGSGSVTIGYLIARKILGKVRGALGLDQCIGCLTAAAPMPTEVANYFASIDIDLLDVYGMSECTGATTISTGVTHQVGTVGHAIGAAEIRIDHVAGRDKPSEGEICYRGRHIMMGYMKDPVKTAEAIDPDGWLHSGDVGVIDSDGLLHITGRIKELIITAGGENIAPVPIEDKIKELCPALANAMMVGDKRKYNVVIFTLKTQLDPETGMSTGKLIGDALRVSDKVTTDMAAIAESKIKGSAWQLYLQGGLDELNSKHSVSNAQKIQKFTVVPGDFSEKGGELTATLKLKRSVAAEKYADVIEKMY